jgi:hypothetical protein
MSIGNLELKIGKYKHFKGGLYEVIGVARHVDSKEDFVVYRPLYGDQGLVIRTKKDFLESVEVNGKQVQRFSFIGENI